jgi:hypothetical protein
MLSLRKVMMLRQGLGSLVLFAALAHAPAHAEDPLRKDALIKLLNRNVKAMGSTPTRCTLSNGTSPARRNLRRGPNCAS